MLSATLDQSTHDVPYLEERIIRVYVHNGFPHSVVISEIVGYLRLHGMGLSEPVRCRVEMADRMIPAGGKREGLMHVIPDLTLPPWTVQVDGCLTYQRQESGKWLGRQGPEDSRSIGCIIVHPHASSGKQAFISYKDPEDEPLARRLQTCLEHVGVKGYMAVDDPQYGTPIWKQKLPRAIRMSGLLIAMWTAHAANSPKNVLREIELAREANIPYMLVREPRIALPDGYDPDLEYAPLSLANPEQSIALLACGIYQRLVVNRIRPHS